jgi:UDP-3-O-[3-hydroxymyristoyl] glucosamine N-acyltransferase
MSQLAGRSDARPSLTLEQVAELVGGRVEGDGALEVRGVAPVDEASPDELAFLAHKRYARYANRSAARGYLVSEAMLEAVPVGCSAVVSDDPYPALRTLLAELFPEETIPPGVHPTAVMGQGVELGVDVHIGAYAVLADGVRVGARSVVGAHSVVGRDVRIGARTCLHPHVVVYPRSVIGSDCILHAGARIGADGFGYTFVDGAHRKMPQVGRAVIEDGVEIGANSAVDRGSLGDTVVGAGTKIDNLVQIGHNVKIGALSLLAGLAGIAGSTRLGKRTWVGGQAGLINHLTVGDDARIAVAARVMRDVPAGETVSGYPARPHREDLRRQAHLGRLPKLAARVERLEAQLERLTGLL